MRIPRRTPLIYHLYFLQLENYDLRRYFKMLIRAWGKPRPPLRKPVRWTLKLFLIAALGFAVHCGLAYFLAVSFYPAFPSLSFESLIVFCLAFYVISYAFSLIIAFVTAMLFPFDLAAKALIIRAARRKIAKQPNLIVVGITGSYGKTTMKEVLAAILSEHFAVLKTAENMNTPLGLARLIRHALLPKTEILIAEMGAYYPGDIRTLTKIAEPKIAVLTGINESHLERFKTIDTTIETKFEIVSGAAPDALAVLNADSSHVEKNYEKYLAGRRAEFFSASTHPKSRYLVKNRAFHDEGPSISFELEEKDGADLGYFKIPLIGEYSVGTVVGAIIIARHLNVPLPEIREGVARLRPVPHRLQPIRAANGAIIVDDSYNGNPAGAEEAIAVLSRFANRRKIYVTPGLIEMGEEAEAIHMNIGRKLAKTADLVVLIENSVTSYIRKGLVEAGYSEKNIQTFPNAAKAHEAVKKIIQPNDVVLFQNDWPDGYF